MKPFVPCLLGALLAAAPALAQTPSDDDLAKALWACHQHKVLPPQRNMSAWELGWGNCDLIESEVAAREAAKEKSKGFVDDLADKLKKGPAQ